MPTVTLKYDLPQDQDDLNIALSADNMSGCIRELHVYLTNSVKDDHLLSGSPDATNRILKRLDEMLIHYNINWIVH